MLVMERRSKDWRVGRSFRKFLVCGLQLCEVNGMDLLKSIMVKVVYFAAIIAVAILTLYGWWWWGPTGVVYVPTHSSAHRAVVNGSYLSHYTTFNIERSTDVRINRELVSRANGLTTHVDLPTTDGYYEKGEYRIIQGLIVPVHTPPGRYELHTRISWPENPMRWAGVYAPVVLVDIKDQSLNPKKRR